MLFYGRHFGLLTLVIAGLAAAVAVAQATGIGSAGMVAAFGLYGGLYSTLIVVTSKSRAPWRRAVACIALGTVVCMLVVVASRRVGPVVVSWLGLDGPVVLLTVASALGAACFGVGLRWLLHLPLPGFVLAALTAGCAASSGALVWSGLYLRAPGLCFAASWWLTFSAGLWITDALRCPGSGTPPVRSNL